MWDMSVRSQMVDFGTDLCGLSFFCVSAEMHMTARDIHMTRQTNSAIMQHSTR